MFSFSLIAAVAISTSLVAGRGPYERYDPYSYIIPPSTDASNTSIVAVTPPDATGDVGEYYLLVPFGFDA